MSATVEREWWEEPEWLAELREECAEAVVERVGEAEARRRGNGSTEIPGVEVAEDDLPSRLVTGDEFILDTPTDVEPVWGRPGELLWLPGESLEIVGPPGVGKTTLAVQLLAARLGLLQDVLGYPVAPAARKCLYVAGDRPRQIARAMRRLFDEEHREILADRLTIWKGPPPSDFAKKPHTLTMLAERADAGTVFLDSLKDCALGLADDEVGAGLNQAIQLALTHEIEITALHHQRKGQQGGPKPKGLEDVYGSTWITAGAGSVLLLWGKAGDVVLELEHLKPPADPVGPLRIQHDHDTGLSRIVDEIDLHTLAARAAHGLTVEGAARALFGVSEPDRNQIEKARRKLDRHPRLERHTPEALAGQRGGTPPVYYRALASEKEPRP